MHVTTIHGAKTRVIGAYILEAIYLCIVDDIGVE